MAATVALPDVNAETYPYSLVQHLLNQTADFSVFAVPDRSDAAHATLTPGHPEDYFGINGGYGIDLKCSLRRFDATVQSACGPDRLGVAQSVGEEAGSLRCKFLFGPMNLAWSPLGEPFCTLYDPWRTRRFAVKDCEFRIGNDDGFTGYGVGRTYPVTVEGKPLVLAAAMGNLSQGSGKFHGLAGTFTLSGRVTEHLGFSGNITIRIVDPEGRLRSDRDLSSFSTIRDPEPEATFIVMRLMKESSEVKTTYGPPPGGGLVSLVTPSQIRAVQYGFITRSYGGLRTEMQIGQVIGNLVADVHFNLLAPPGTAEKPVPFTTQELYTFTSAAGRVVGSIRAAIEDGEAFDLRFPAAPGQPGVRFAGAGRILGGSGFFEGAVGTLSVNSLIGIAPHALSLIHVLQLRDPHGRFRAGRMN